MRAILLSAGKGTRLGKLTETTPKCLLQVGSKTMLEHWYYLFKKFNITDVLINTHHLYTKVLIGYSGLMEYGINTTFTYEPELLGTAKTIFKNKDFIREDRHFLIVFADTWMQPDIRLMTKVHKKRRGLGTLGLYKSQEMQDQGCITVENRKVVNIEEKPQNPKGQWAFAGIMIGTQAMFKFYAENMTDLVRDWLPKVKEGLNPYFIDSPVLDIGTLERYEKANNIVSGMGLKIL